jgi:hypothetical protein
MEPWRLAILLEVLGVFISVLLFHVLESRLAQIREILAKALSLAR